MKIIHQFLHHSYALLGQSPRECSNFHSKATTRQQYIPRPLSTLRVGVCVFQASYTILSSFPVLHHPHSFFSSRFHSLTLSFSNQLPIQAPEKRQLREFRDYVAPGHILPGRLGLPRQRAGFRRHCGSGWLYNCAFRSQSCEYILHVNQSA